MATTTAEYVKAHKAVTRERGPASSHDCVRCGEQAHEWSYDYSDPNPQKAGTSLFSLDIDRYEPMCRSCHDQFEKEADPRTADTVRRRSEACADGVRRRLAEPGGVDVFVNAGKKVASMRRKCSECPKACSPASLAMHQKHSGHRGYEEI